MRFQGKVCVVTGGGSGIGRAVCQRFAAEGGKVVIVDIDENKGKETEKSIRQNSAHALFIKTDISYAAEIKAAVTQVLQTWGRIDILINNAAIMTFQPIVELPEEAWDKLMAVNLKSIFLFCKLCIPQMDHGVIINVSSVHGHETTPNVLPYAASKGAMEAFTRGLSLEYKPEKVRANCVAPGAVDTPMLWSNPNIKSGKEKLEGAVGKPEDIAAAICFLASDEAGYINGTTLAIDGGRLNIL
jgi:NAD(P)-dependent dehydrogenase (short-subunit alcohol dehydrogenase family)